MSVTIIGFPNQLFNLTQKPKSYTNKAKPCTNVYSLGVSKNITTEAVSISTSEHIQARSPSFAIHVESLLTKKAT
jgi:hypothetical protein